MRRDNFTIRGNAEIEMRCLEAASNITLHAADLSIENGTVTVVEKGGKRLNIANIEYDEDREFFIIHLNESFTVGKSYVTKIHYTAYLKDNLKGFYRSAYKDKETNTTEILATTQFQVSDARRAFPCFDEPGIKANFKVSLGRQKDMSSISNMPIEFMGMEMKGTDDYVWDHYQQSVKMSTYLLAFVVSKFRFTEATRSNNVRFRIWSTPNSLDQTEYAKDIGPKMLEYFESYFNVPFPLPKQDMIAIPDFGAGAMENWGLITFRESALMYKQGVSSAKSKQRIAAIVSHELAHQWFGNLVTPSWWTDLWLNEGFASYVEYLGVEAAQPEMKYLEQFVVVDLQDVFSIDGLKSSHPISIPVQHPDEIAEIFDKISYKKGASIIRMMNHYLTTETFRKGLTNYLEELQFSAAKQDDLWRHLTSQGHKDGKLPPDMNIKTIMDTWTLQMGFPLVSVERNYANNTAEVRQDRFLIGEASDEETSEGYGWWIPITFAAAGSSFEDTYNKNWMKEDEKSKEIKEMPENGTAVVFNVQQTGYYRVNYDTTNWRLIANTLLEDHTAIHVINRAQIMDDALNLAKSGLLDYDTALSVTGYLSKELEYIPWKASLTGFEYIKNMLKATPAYGDFKRYMLRLVDPIYTQLGFKPKPTDTHLQIQLRTLAVDWACSMGSYDCLQNTERSFAAWMRMAEPDRENWHWHPIDVNLRYETFCSAISNGGEAEFNFAWERYKRSQVASEKATILSALSCTKETWLLNRYLNMSITPSSGVRKQDGYKVIGDIAANTVGRSLAFDFINEEWETVHDVYGQGAFFMSKMMGNVMSDRNKNIEIRNLKAFEKDHASDLGTATRTVRQAIEGGEANLAWMKKNYDTIWSWLRRQNEKQEHNANQEENVWNIILN